jgi:hypothetical protein
VKVYGKRLIVVKWFWSKFGFRRKDRERKTMTSRKKNERFGNQMVGRDEKTMGIINFDDPQPGRINSRGK